jgi:predicted AAA+ superfamily ATPase
MTIQCLADIANSYESENILIPFGDDFSFQKAEETYDFIENMTSTLLDPDLTGIS